MTLSPRRIGLAAALVAVVLALPAIASPREDALTDRMVEMQLATLPIGVIMQDIARQDAGWPAADRDDISAKQLACLRREISPDGQRVLVRPKIAAYVAADPARAEVDVALLETGAGKLFGDLVLAGAAAETSGGTTDPADVMMAAGPTVQANFLKFFESEEHQAARDAFGIGGLTAGANGEDFGAKLALELMRHGFDTCGVSIDPR